MSSDRKTPIVVEGLSKQYRIGEMQHGSMLREALVRAMLRPFRNVEPDPQAIWALRDVSLSVEPNEVVGVIGRNGSGKTTLLKLLSRITYPTEGKLTINGRVASLVEVGTGFHNELTGRDNIFLNGSILGLRKREIQERFDAIVAFSGVEKFIDTPIKRFSTGMRLRLGFAVAAHLSTEILLVDEVLAVGDADFQARCLETLHEVGRDGRTVLFVSHNLEAVERLCSRTIWLDGGRLRGDGKTHDVIAEYLQTTAGAHSTSVDLTRSRRSGSGEARLTAIEFLDRDGAPREVVRSGDAVTLRLHYEADSRVEGAHFGIMISSDLGTLVAHPNTWSSSVEPGALEPGTGSIDLRIEELNLLPGRYPLTLYIERYGEGRSIDLLEQCSTLIVHGSDATGRVLERRAGMIYFRAEWSRTTRTTAT